MATSTEEADKLTYEQLEFRLGVMTKSRDEAVDTLRKEREDNKRLRLMLRGWTDEHFTLNVTISPEMLMGPEMWSAVHLLMKNYVRETCYALDEKLGGVLRRLQEAVMHIHYLENHAASRGVQFKPWAVSERDRDLYY